MSRPTTHRLIPIGFCIIAALTLVTAGWLLLDQRHQLEPTTDGDDEFVSYRPATPVEPAPPTETDERPESELDEALAGDEDLTDERIAAEEDWEVLEPIPKDSPNERRLEPTGDPQPAGNSNRSGPTGRIIVVTNFTRATVDINGDPYPTYSDDGQNRGMEVAANTTHQVLVEFDGNEQLYEVTLRPGERRMLMVELTGLGDGKATARPERSTPDRSRRERTSQRREEREEEDLEEDEGRITVYSRPRGEIYVGSQSTGEQTPGTIDVDPGRHEVQVEYREGEMSETKTVRVREGSRVKLFFRESD